MKLVGTSRLKNNRKYIYLCQLSKIFIFLICHLLQIAGDGDHEMKSLKFWTLLGNFGLFVPWPRFPLSLNDGWCAQNPGGGQLSRKFQKFCPTFNVEQIKLTPGAIPPLLLFMIINTILQHLDIQSHQGAPIPL